MRARLNTTLALLTGNPRADRVVPPSGHTATLTSLTAAAMAFLAVFALALSLATGRLADRWTDALANTATVRISAPLDQLDVQTRKVLEVLATTPGVASARALTPDEIRALLEPWIGPDLPVDSLPIPQLVEITETDAGFDADGLRLRLAAEAPGAAFVGQPLPMVLDLAARPGDAQADWPLRRFVERAGLIQLAPDPVLLPRLRGANTPTERDRLAGEPDGPKAPK